MEWSGGGNGTTVIAKEKKSNTVEYQQYFYMGGRVMSNVQFIIFKNKYCTLGT